MKQTDLLLLLFLLGGLHLNLLLGLWLLLVLLERSQNLGEERRALRPVLLLGGFGLERK